MFNLRNSLAVLSFSVALAIPAAHAATLFTYTVNGGTPITFVDTPGYSVVGNYTLVASSDAHSSLQAVFFNSSFSTQNPQYGFGNVDFSFQYNNSRLGTSFSSLLDGQQLYTGSENNHPEFIAGTYVLSSDPSVSDSTGGTLVIGATPEPSSLMLLGTGTLAAAGAMRRRFRKV